MKTMPMLFAVITLAGCVVMRDRPEESWDSCALDPSLSERGLTWLASEQSTKGYWGEEEKSRGLLTSIVTAAFLSHYETPWSLTFGQTVRSALHYLVDYEAPLESALPVLMSTDSAQFWVMGEAYAITRIPIIGNRFAQVADRVTSQPGALSPFSLWAASNLPIEQADRAQAALLQAYQADEPNLLTCAVIARASRELDRSTAWWQPYDQAMAAVMDQMPGNWRQTEYPLLSLVVLCDVFAEANRTHAGIWWQQFWTDVTATIHEPGYWSPVSLGVEAARELQAFTNERDRTIYTTAMMLNAMHQAYRFPRPRHGDPEWENRFVELEHPPADGSPIPFPEE